MFLITGVEMGHSLLKFEQKFGLKSGFKSGALCLIAAAFLVGCGVKPSLNELAVPKKDNRVALEEPRAAETIDGQVDGKEPISKSNEKRGFLLDFLL